MRLSHALRLRREGFTLVELIIVILIISLLIAITLPALGAARNAVRKTQSRSNMSNFLTAYKTFQNDHDGLAPGKFSQRELGLDSNVDAGFTPMENALLDLLGSDAVIGRVSDVDADSSAYPNFDSSSTSIIKVGVDTSDGTQQYYVNAALLGAGDDAYFQPNADTLVAQTNEGDNATAHQVLLGISALATTTAPGNFANTAPEGIAQMVDFVDAFGQPVLLWVPDEFGPQVRTSSKMDALDDFVLDPADAGDLQEAAQFYPTANFAFLASKALGKKLKDQTLATDSSAATSTIGFAGQMDTGFNANRRRTFMALFGNPSFPAIAGSHNTIAQAVSANEVVPARPRGEVILHSAGIDGIYFSNKDSGFRSKGAIADQLEYWQNFSANGSSYDNDDLVGTFDDVVLTGN